jgi:hypothetical protein
MAQRAKGIYTSALSADHWRTAIAQSAEGAALTGLGRYQEADGDLSHSLQILSKNSGAPTIFRSITQRSLDDLHRAERGGGAFAAAPAAATAKSAPSAR